VTEPVWQADDKAEADRARDVLREAGIGSDLDDLTIRVRPEHVHRALDLLEASRAEPPAQGRFERSLNAMDAVAFDHDGRLRPSSTARMDYAFWNSLLAGPVGWIVGIVAFGALAALLLWLLA
jgi:hypothetical protein